MGDDRSQAVRDQHDAIVSVVLHQRLEQRQAAVADQRALLDRSGLGAHISGDVAEIGQGELIHRPDDERSEGGDHQAGRQGNGLLPDRCCQHERCAQNDDSDQKCCDVKLARVGRNVGGLAPQQVRHPGGQPAARRALRDVGPIKLVEIGTAAIDVVGRGDAAQLV
ncbi:hypothetical protein NKI46_05330 [Mesorhizobium sp. M0615]|uniref:hypothetical protein n=1 Tax=Mesorhizobium sp. M0615 TaxID=2956971 RepID=UPI003334A88C